MHAGQAFAQFRERSRTGEVRAGEAVTAAVAGEAELTLAQLKSMGTVGGATSG